MLVCDRLDGRVPLRYFSAFVAITYRSALNFNQVPGKPGACSRVAN